jgi:Mg-chelatase subunit ChlD
MNGANTHIHVILDRSGSMEAVRDDAIGGFNAFLQEQRALGSNATLTLVQFDSQDPYDVVHDFRPLDTVPPLDHRTFVPRGSTPLLDALGRGVVDLERRLAALPRALRPGKVVFAIITDGQENASREFGHDQIRKMLRDCQEKRNWVVAFLSSELEAVHEAGRLGVHDGARMHFAPSGVGAQAAFQSLSKAVGRFRSGPDARLLFTDEEREEQEKLRRGSSSR